jgi:hypothetical protein
MGACVAAPSDLSAPLSDLIPSIRAGSNVPLNAVEHGHKLVLPYVRLAERKGATA